MSISTYSPKDIIVSIAGLHTVTGYADGTFVKIHKETKPFEKSRAMDGTISRIYNQDETFTVDLTIQYSSPTNDVLTILYNVDKALHIGKFPMIVRDSLGRTAFIAGTAWVEEIPDITFSNSMEVRTWKFGCSDVVLTIGGAGDAGLIDEALLVGSAALPILKSFLGG